MKGIKLHAFLLSFFPFVEIEIMGIHSNLVSPNKIHAQASLYVQGYQHNSANTIQASLDGLEVKESQENKLSYNNFIEQLYTLGEHHSNLAAELNEQGNVNSVNAALDEAIRYHEQIIDEARIFSYEEKREPSECRRTNNGFSCSFPSDSKIYRISPIDILSATNSFLHLQQAYVEQERDKLDIQGKITNISSDSPLLKALAASEHARALHIDAAIIKNNTGLFSDFNSRAEEFFTAIYAKRSSIDDLQQVAKDENAWIVNYSLITHEDLALYNRFLESPHELRTHFYIWVISPSGRVSFVDQTSELLLFEQELRSQNLLNGSCQEDLNSDECRADQISALGQGIRITRRGLGVIDRGQQSEEVLDRLSVSDQEFQLSQLYKLLIQPIEDFLPVTRDKRVILIPDGPLHFVPFSALIDPNSKEYLIERNTLLTAPSFRTLLLSRRNRDALNTNKIRKVLIAGNPKMPTFNDETDSHLSDLEPLPGAEQEAIAIRNLMQAKGGFDIKFLLNERASEEKVVEDISSFQIIHLATHGIIENEDNENEDNFGNIEIENDDMRELVDDMRELVNDSLRAFRRFNPRATGSLVFSANNNEDGLLEAKELAYLDLSNTELVVLSACNTAKGNLSPGGVIGLPFSLSIAGVPSTVVSLWAVEDESTAEFMKFFYEQLLNDPGFDKAQALRKTMLEMLERYPDTPGKWAAFTLVGAPD